MVNNKLKIAQAGLHRTPPSRNTAGGSEGEQALTMERMTYSGATISEDPTSGMRKAGIAFAAGMTLFGMANGAMAAEPPEAAVEVQIEQADPFEEAGKRVRGVGQELAEEGKAIGQEFMKETKEVREKGAEVGKKIMKETEGVRREGAELGRKIGKGASDAAKSFWKGLRGK